MEEKKLTGYPSVDKPWLKYYSEEAIQAELPNDTLYESLKRCNEDNMSAVAIEYYGKKISYGSLIKKIDQVAGALSAYGIKRGDTITVCSLNSPETVYLLYGCNKIGAVANMVSGLSDLDDLIEYINSTNTKYIFTLDNFLDKIVSALDKTTVEQVVVMNITESMGGMMQLAARYIKGLKPKVLPKDCRFMRWREFLEKSIPTDVFGDSESVAVITYTGGTTGGSKGVMLSSKAIISTAYQYILCDAGMKRSQTWLQFFPLFIAYGIGPSLHLPLMAGLTLIVRIPMTERLSIILKKYKPNHVISGPAMWVQLAEENIDMDLSFLIEPTSGGDKLPIHLEEKVNDYFKRQGANCPLMNGYGLTEVAAGVAINFTKAYCLGSVGVPFCKNIIAAFDLDSGTELRYGEEGEICIHTPSLMDGYVGKENEMIQIHSDGREWLHSGDLGYISEEGFVFITGRLKRYFLYMANGEAKKVFSADIEKVLLTHPLIENCAIVPIMHEAKNQVAKAYVKLKNNVNVADAEHELHQYCLDNLSERFRPEVFEFVQAYPLTKIGKIDYRKLEQQANQERIEHVTNFV